MTHPFHTEAQAANASPSELIVYAAFDYTPLQTEIAQQVQTAAERIRQMVKRTLEDLLTVGQELLTVKKALPYGSFGPWLRAEFGWTERTARNFMAVAERFGSKTEIISELRIDPTAAYLLASPSAPEEASAAALQRAQSGERITAPIAKQILGNFRSKPGRREWPSSANWPTGELRGQLMETLRSFRRRWNPQEVTALAQQLRDFADSLEKK